SIINRLYHFEDRDSGNEDKISNLKNKLNHGEKMLRDHEQYFQEIWREIQGGRIEDVTFLAALWHETSASTTKYSKWSFLPRYLYLQFSKAANAFFLFITILQVIFLYMLLN
ncbi:hypothetical protein H1C71_014167, partial [Ictidomys tridecemlineatus]